jgi:DNA-binding CsgD family transcriptional regulator
LFRDALARFDHCDNQGVCSFPIRGEESPFVAHILPIRRSARDIFIRCTAILVLTPVTRPEAPPVELVRSLFDLTPVEARVARGLAAGRTVEAIAADGGTSLNTVRTHVRGVLTKTGCNRQTDVVALLNGIWLPRTETTPPRASLSAG